MKNGFESFKDFLYDAIDYILILGIIITVVLIIGWRLDLLFINSEELSTPPKDTVAEDRNLKGIEELKRKNETNKDEVEESKSLKEAVVDTSKPKAEEKKETSNPIKNEDNIIVEIPSGANLYSIASLLKEKGVISDTSIFIDKCEELDKSTKLKSGSFSLSSKDSVETIIESLTK